MKAGAGLTRYFAIWGRNLGEDWQEGLYEVQKADCWKRRRVRNKSKRRGRTSAYSRSWWKERNRVGWVNFAIDVYTGEVTTPTWQIASIRHVSFAGHVHSRTGRPEARSHWGRMTLSILSQ